MSRPGLFRSCAAGVALWMAGGAPAGAQSPNPDPAVRREAPSRPSSADPGRRGELPVSIERIREALESSPQSVLRLPERPTFSVSVEGRTPRIEDFIDVESLGRGPSQPTSFVHQEFMRLTTPPEARPYGSFTSGELAVIAAQAFGTGVAASTLPSLIRDAIRSRREERARREVQQVLEELARRQRESDTAPPP